MNRIKQFRLVASCAIGLGLAAGAVHAQSTDAYHSIQIFPVVVDTASFSQRFSFHNPNLLSAVTVTPKYYPATGTSQAPNLINCPTFDIAAGKTVTFTSLRAVCPSLAAGSQFGFLYTSERNLSSNLPYAGFSRVSNPQGNGFTVESFPASTFTSADSFINGIRRLAATPSSPAFQTNCFLANLNEESAGGTATSIHYTLYNSGSAVIGGGDVVLAPGQTLRLLDVFATGGAVAGDYNDASVRFEENNASEEPGLMSLCTTQENTTFGADFRIAKQEVGAGGLGYPGDVIGSQDNHVSRETLVSADGVGRTFEIASGASGNTHVIYFRHPDYQQCELINPATGVRAVNGHGLEMRLLDQDGLVVSGGDLSTGWSETYMGDKNDRNGGSNSRYTIEVESNEQNTGAVRAYRIHCQSGSGHSLGDIIRYKEAVNRF
ncbi:MAG: hypothetical protein A3E01_10910 [Gammaproteobacteria bacterium RIFCSPHIGHO2_12_FULL_63_22]|nr:MAG: hypothetical protein A3E01_10910 [Gammaproteobacteria bacterium RIFCSPHIGHO2_12_FULL_63_22]